MKLVSFIEMVPEGNAGTSGHRRPILVTPGAVRYVSGGKQPGVSHLHFATDHVVAVAHAIGEVERLLGGAA